MLFPERKSARPADHETWTEDIERAVVCISRQDFPFAATLLNRWLSSRAPQQLDDKGLYLYGRSLVLLGDLQRDQGAILGPLSARHSYLTARGMFTELDIPRRVAQIELSLAVVQEMSGQLESSARHYELRAGDAQHRGHPEGTVGMSQGVSVPEHEQRQITDEQFHDATLIWDYHQMGHEQRPCSAAIGLGSHDLGVATAAHSGSGPEGSAVSGR